MKKLDPDREYAKRAAKRFAPYWDPENDEYYAPDSMLNNIETEILRAVRYGRRKERVRPKGRR